MRKIGLLLSMAFFLTACGFHLRGFVALPKWLTNIAIISPEESKPFVAILNYQLESNKIKVNPDPARAEYWIIINKTDLQQQIISIGASANSRQYQLILYVQYILKTRNGQVVKPLQTLSVSRQFTVNNNRILGSDNEENILVNEMRTEAVIQLINRLSR